MKAWIGAALLALTLPLAAQDDNAEPAPERAVEQLESMLIEHMKAGDEISFEQRFERLRPLLGEIMAVERMGRYLFGRDWQAFEPGQRERFAGAFLDLSAATYANRFDTWNGERFDPVEVRRQGEDRAVVRRRLTTGSGKKIAFDYLMSHGEAGWQIVTIITDGVSDLALKRSQYSRILENEGFDGVIEHIGEATESQRSG